MSESENFIEVNGANLGKKRILNEQLLSEQNVSLSEFIEDSYLNKGQSTWEISRELNVSSSTVRRYMDQLGIPRRSGSEARILERTPGK